MDTPVPQELYNSIDIFSPNESELGRLTGMPTDSFEQISQAVLKCHKMVSVDTQIFAWSFSLSLLLALRPYVAQISFLDLIKCVYKYMEKSLGVDLKC